MWGEYGPKTLIHAAECWATTKKEIDRLQLTEHSCQPSGYDPDSPGETTFL